MRIYGIQVFYGAENYPKYDGILEEIAGISDASGMGMGERDLEWSYRTEKKARSVFDKLCKLRLPGITMKFTIERL